MNDPSFDATVIFLFAADDGAAGVVLNRPTDIRVADVLPALCDVAADPSVVFHGGPIRIEEALVVGVTDSDIAVLEADVAAAAEMDSVRVFAGYAGWEPGQLETEIDEGAWVIAAATPDDVLTAEPAGLWRGVFARQDGGVRRYRHYPDDPRLN